MRIPYVLSLLVSSSVFLGAVPAPQPEVGLFPIPTEGITIPAAGNNGWKLEQLVTEYARVTDQHFMISDETQRYLKQDPVPLDRELEVAPEAVHSVVEAILSESDLMLTIVREANPRLVAVRYLGSAGRSNLRQMAPFVPAEELEAWRDHPAYLVHTVITLENLDVRTLTNSMRAMLTDANTQQILPVGNSNSLILTGFGPQVNSLAKMLFLINEREGEEIVNPAKNPERAEGAR